LFSIVPKGPDTQIFGTAYRVCGKVGIAKLALPGSAELGENLAEVFAVGCNSVILENHRITVVGSILSEACARLETLDFYAR
jgi:L-fuculose-phosphate aldolase